MSRVRKLDSSLCSVTNLLCGHKSINCSESQSSYVPNRLYVLWRSLLALKHYGFKVVLITSAFITSRNFVLTFVSCNAWTILCLEEFCSKRDDAFSTNAALIICLRTNPLLAHYVNVKWKAEAPLDLICCWKKVSSKLCSKTIRLSLQYPAKVI